MYDLKDEKKLLKYIYLLCIFSFVSLFFTKKPLDYGALIIAAVIIILIAYSHFIIRKFFPQGDKYILVIASVLSLIGITVIYRINDLFAIKQIIWFSTGMAAFITIVVLLPDLKSFSSLRYVYMVMTLIFMGMATFYGTELHGSKNWVIIKGFSFQPSEFGKLFLVAYLASALLKYKSFKDLIEPAMIVMICLGFMVLQKDLGSALILFGISLTMLYIATSKFKYIAVCVGLFIVGCVISYMLFNHIRIRFTIWRNPWPYATGRGYQIIQAMFSIATGGLFGTGLGLGYPNYVPVNMTDFIFAVICEEMGILMGFAIIILYFLLFYRSMRAAINTDSDFSRLIAVGYSSMITTQVIVIIGGVTGMIPLTGITLPLISYGGSSMVITFIALGILQKISEEGNLDE